MTAFARFWICFVLCVAACLAADPCLAQQVYDVAIIGGRVMDPESGLDAVRNVGISGGAIRRISRTPISGKIRIDARGLVVAPGFIDLHAHGQDMENNRLQAMDGVTTALELEGGTVEVPKWYAERKGKRGNETAARLADIENLLA